jgi:hypothetical protein
VPTLGQALEVRGDDRASQGQDRRAEATGFPCADRLLVAEPHREVLLLGRRREAGIVEQATEV